MDYVHRHSTVEVMVSFYGPAAQGNAGLLRDGLQVPQNREALYGAGMGFVEASRIVAAPALINTQWVRKIRHHHFAPPRNHPHYAVQNIDSLVDNIITSH